jgi:DHA2 family multidrug resistance protein
MAGPILGPLLGGWLTEYWNWRAVFYVNLPLGALALLILIAGLPSRPLVRRRFDLFGFAMITICLSSLQLLLDRGTQIDWFDATEAWIYAALIVSSGWIAVIHLATAREPLFPRDLFTDRNFVVALLYSMIMGVVMFATMALLPPMLQRLFGYSVIDTGMVLMPRGVGVLISMQITGILVRRGWDGRMLLTVGFLMAGISLWEMSLWSLQTDQSHIVASSFLQGLGMGLVFIPLNATAFATMAARLRTDGSGLLFLMRSLGASIGISIVTVLLARNLQTSHQDLTSHVTGSMTDLVDVSAIDRFQVLGTSVLSMIDAEINRQAAMIAYIDDFRAMMWMTFAAVPLALLMRKADLTKPKPVEDLPH